jgi:hypothetical protein
MAKMTVRARATFLPEERFLPLRPALQAHLAKFGDAISSENFLSICCEMVLEILKGTLKQISADEGSVWLLDQEKQHLVVAYNSGPNAEKIIGFKQPLSKGIVSLVVASERAFVENQVYKNVEHSAALDQRMGNTTYAMIAVPLYFLNEVRGVISCVQLVDVLVEKGQATPAEETPPGFSPQDLATMQTTAAVIRDLIDYRLLGVAVGWNRH